MKTCGLEDIAIVSEPVMSLFVRNYRRHSYFREMEMVNSSDGFASFPLSLDPVEIRNNNGFQSFPSNQHVDGSDVALVMDQTGRTEDQARMALERCNGDIVNAIMDLTL